MSKYFVSHDVKLILSSKNFVSVFDSLEAKPAPLSGRVNSYQSSWNHRLGRIVFAGDKDAIGFHLRQDHTEPLIVHHAAGGPVRMALIALQRISLSKMVQDELKARMAMIGPTYTSLHIRYTDYVTDFEDRVLAMRGKISGPIFLATDNAKAIEFCQNVFGKERVFNFTTFPQNKSGAPIHSDVDFDARTNNVDAICDLVMLAAAEKYYYFPLSKKNKKLYTVYSGFSELAQMLHTDEALFKQFIGEVPFGFATRLRLKLRKFRYRLQGLVWSVVPPGGR